MIRAKRDPSGEGACACGGAILTLLASSGPGHYHVVAGSGGAKTAALGKRDAATIASPRRAAKHQTPISASSVG